MRHIYKVLAAVGGLSLTFGGTTALAGHCGPQYQPCPVRIAPPPPPPPMANCHVIPPAPMMPQIPGNPCTPPVIVHPGAPAQVDPVVIHSSRPLGHLRTIQFHGSPHVNITRIHGQVGVPGLTDAPTGFTQGCHPESTEYCRRPAPVVRAMANAAPAPVHIAAPAPKVAMPAPRMAAPAPMVRTAPAKIVSPALAPAPTYAPPRIAAPVKPAQRVMTMARPAPRPVVLSAPVPRTVTITAPKPVAAPKPAPIVAAPAKTWTKVSGPTMVGGMNASQVVCSTPTPHAPAPQPHTCSGPVHHGHMAPAYQPQMPAHGGWPMAPRYGYNH